MSLGFDGTAGITFNDSSTQNTAATGFGFKNRIINGAMVIDQRNNGASVNAVTGTAAYAVDRFNGSVFGASQPVYSMQQVADAPSGTGLQYSVKITAGTGYAGDSSSAAEFGTIIEGYNVADFNLGTANAATFTLSFWVKSSLSGAFLYTLRNQGDTRAYNSTFTINSANTWEYKTITIAGDTAGTWNKTNLRGLSFLVPLQFTTGGVNAVPLNQWINAIPNPIAPSANYLLRTTGATIQFTGVQLEKGSTATSFDYRPYGTELALCQRYYTTFLIKQYMYSTAADGWINTYVLPQTMRASPTFVASGAWTSINVAATEHSTVPSSYALTVIPNTAGMCGFAAGNATATLSAEL